MDFESTLNTVRDINNFSYAAIIRSYIIGSAIWTLNTGKQNADAVKNGWRVDPQRLDSALADVQYWLLHGVHYIPEFDPRESLAFALDLFQREQTPEADVVAALPKEWQDTATAANTADAAEKRHFAEHSSAELVQLMLDGVAGDMTLPPHPGFPSTQAEQMAFEKLHAKIYDQCEKQAQRVGRMRGRMAMRAAADVSQLDGLLQQVERHIEQLDRASDNGIVTDTRVA
jgi:hypothetical protein